ESRVVPVARVAPAPRRAAGLDSRGSYESAATIRRPLRPPRQRRRPPGDDAAASSPAFVPAAPPASLLPRPERPLAVSAPAARDRRTPDTTGRTAGRTAAVGRRSSRTPH